MKKDKSDQIIREEIQKAMRENPEISYALSSNRSLSNEHVMLEEDWKTDVGKAVLKVGVAAGTSLLTSMLLSKDGRNNLADICVALPDFLKDVICGAPESLLDEFDMEGPAGRNVALAIRILCRSGVSVLGSPLYVLAFILRKLTDDAAKDVVDKHAKSTEKEKGLSGSPAQAQDSPWSQDSNVVDADVIDVSAQSMQETLRYLRILRENDFIKK